MFRGLLRLVLILVVVVGAAAFLLGWWGGGRVHRVERPEPAVATAAKCVRPPVNHPAAKLASVAAPSAIRAGRNPISYLRGSSSVA